MSIPLPPTLESLPCGTKLKAGMGETTVLADLDFETYSEAGYIWDEATRKYKAPPNAAKKGLPVIGAAKYAEHHSTEVLCCAYDLKDGKGKRLWTPSQSPPHDLFEYLAKGGLLEAWNVSFERWIWTKVCQRRYGWPPVAMTQWRDAAAKSVAHALPKSLDPAGEVMNIVHKKLKDGWRLLTKFSMPRNPTKNDPRRRIQLHEDLEDSKKLYQYNLQDIAAEAELSSLIPDLTPFELEFWQCDQAINFRGVQLDIKSILNAIKVVEQAHAKYNRELREITGGAVDRASEIAKIRNWMAVEGVNVPVLDAEKVTQLLGSALPYNIRRVLQIRELIGSAAVKKLYAMSNQITESGRVHDLFIYHSARTGRAAGAGPQPQNLPNSGPIVKQCTCRRHYMKELDACPWCGLKDMLSEVEWNSDAAQDAIDTINTGNLECVEYFWGNAIDVISGSLRGMFIASERKDLICSDYSAIEAVVLAELAGESWRQEVFRTHGKIYETSATKITGKTLAFYLEHKKSTGQHHLDRKLGKVAELACFTHDTQVLTNRGYVAIMDVLKNDLLWDGIEWVKHQGVVKKAKKKIITLDGVRMTPEHPITVNGSWREAKELALNKSILTQSLGNGSENLPTLERMNFDQQRAIDLQDVNAHAVNLLHRLIVICELDDQQDVMCVLRGLQNQPRLSGLKHTKNTDILYRIVNIDEDLETVCHLLSVAVTTLKIRPTLIMGGEELQYKTPGEITKPNFFRILLQFPAGIMSFLKWIELIVIEAMNPEIFDLFQGQIISLISEKYQNCKDESQNLRNVYDIVNAGHRHRFTIKTDSGHLIVHNSGYGGWIGAWKAFKADSFMSDEEIKQAILAWRKASPAIVEFWGGQVRGWHPEYFGLEGAAVQAVLYPGEKFECRGFTFIVRADVLYCKLLSGRYLTYHSPRLSPSQRRSDTLTLSFEGWNSNPQFGAPGWIRIETYSGKLTENIVQAVSRDILAHAIVNLEKSGYPVVLHVHDEIVSEVPENFGSIAEFEKIMSTMPEWAAGWPVRASGGWRAKRYGK